MSTIGGFLIERLLEWDIHRIYGYPGDGINGIIGALDRASEQMRSIQVRHEEMAALMACAFHNWAATLDNRPAVRAAVLGRYEVSLGYQSKTV